MKTKKYYQQGDVLFKEITKKEIKGKQVVGNTVIKSASNQHSLGKGDYEIFTDGEQLYINVKTEAEVKHQEHDSKTLPKGYYKVETVLEYDHFLEESKEVID